MRDRRTCQGSGLFRTGPGIITGICSLILLILLTGTVSGAVFLKNGSDVSDTDQAVALISDQGPAVANSRAEFFYNNQCGACHVAMVYLSEFSNAHPDVQIDFIDVFNSSDNKELFEERKAAYNRQYVAVPVVFIGNAGLEGESAIREYFEPLVSLYGQSITGNSRGEEAPAAGVVRQHRRTVISIPLVLLAGIVDGINPCACAVIILLIACLLGGRNRKTAARMGLTFAAAIFCFYLLAGSGIISLTKHSLVVTGFSLIFSLAAVIAGIFIIGKAIFKQPCWTAALEEHEEKASGIFRRYSLLLLFILGFTAGILEIPCAGSIYMSILDLISFRVNIEQGLVYLFLYNLAFIIPLLVITGLVYLAIPKEPDTEAQKARQPGFLFFTGLLLFVFAFLNLSGII